MTHDPIHIALAAENNYFEGLLVTAWSIAENCSRARDLVFHVLDGGISPKNWRFLVDRLSTFKCTVDRIQLNPSTLSGLGQWHGNNSMTFARLLLPELLPTVKHILYTDVDFLWLKDVSDLWALRLDTCILQHTHTEVRGFEIGNAEKQWAEKRGVKLSQDNYFCAGMLLMNLDQFRKEGFHSFLLKYIREQGGSAPFQDQTLLNMFVQDRQDKSVLPATWQTFTCDPNSSELSDASALHYAGDTPWKSIHAVHHLLTDHQMLWHRIHARARGIRVWTSLRICNSPIDIITCRLLYLLLSHSKLLRIALKGFLSLRGNMGSYQFLLAFMKRCKPRPLDVRATAALDPNQRHHRLFL